MPRPARLAVMLVVLFVVGALAAWGQSSPQSKGSVVPLVVRTARSGFNRLLVTITVCRPGTTECAAIDNVMVDTGSTGLRLESFAVPRWLHFPAFAGPNRRAMAECVRFVGSSGWGALYRADVHIGGLTASDLPIQVFEDDARLRPADCERSAGQPTSNGTLGVSTQLTDCLGTCNQSQSRPQMYDCDEAKCLPLRDPIDSAYRLPNPVGRLDDGRINGLIFDLPSPPLGGTDAVRGDTYLWGGHGPGQPAGCRTYSPAQSGWPVHDGLPGASFLGKLH